MKQLCKMGLAVLFGFTLTLTSIGCDGASEPAPSTPPAGDAPAGDEGGSMAP
ncbi:hypothetical protein [Rubinisphaera sp.]|uniref:hypothetical protein n=1 Tax=Rubinisphaera sp. TaxID=2024857 RepID=UPI0025E62E6D|nr:hypothetical protein [Rubinisphaera sp.]|tara:strand:+ start:483 stop:638 length:156 start_codon:yes stop_codon:yes gene_type:complete